MSFGSVISRAFGSALRSVACDHADEPTFVAVGDAGLLFVGQGYETTGASVEPVDWVEVTGIGSVDLLGVDYGEGYWLAVGGGGTVLRSAEGTVWEFLPVFTTSTLRAVVSGQSDTSWLVGGDDGIYHSDDSGATWAQVSAVAVRAIHTTGSGTFVAVGDSGAVYTSTNYVTWTARTSTVTASLYAVHCATGANPQTVVAVGVGTIIVSADSGLTWAEMTVPTSEPLHGVVDDGAGSWVAVGGEGITLHSTDTETWSEQRGLGEWSVDLYGLVHADGRYVVVGAQIQVGYSLSGQVSPQFEAFHPLSDEYRANDVVVAQAAVHLIAVSEYDAETNEWVFKPRRIRGTASGTFNTFTGAGSYFADLPGGGQLLQGCTVAGNSVILGESDRISLLVPGAYAAWDYRPLATGLWAVSNFVELDGEVFFVASDGLMYRASTTGVRKVETGFDMRQYEDWAAETAGPMWLRYDPTLQSLLILQMDDRHVLHVVSPAAGSYTELGLPRLVVGDVTWVPAALTSYSVPESQACVVGYRPTEAGNDNGLDGLLSVQVRFSDATYGIYGRDEINQTGSDPWVAEIHTGLIRVAAEGEKVTVREIEVRTYSDTIVGIVPPRLMVQVRSTAEEEWRNLVDAGTITVSDTSIYGVAGEPTAFSNLLLAGDDVTTTVYTPCPARKAVLRTTPDGVVFTNLAATAYTVTDTHEIELATPVPTGVDLYVFWPGRPSVIGRVGDYVESDSRWHQITAVTDVRTLEADHYLPSGTESGTYHRTIQAPGGEGVLTFGVGQECEEVQVRIVIAPQYDSSASRVFKVRSLVLVLGDTGEEQRGETVK